MRIGHHTNIKELLKSHEFNAYQVFISSPRAWAIKINKEIIKKLHELYLKRGFFLVIHGKYLYNHCRTNETNAILEQELRIAAEIGDDVGVIIHQGKNMPELQMTREEAIDTFCYGIKQILHSTRDIKNKIILENSAHQGNELGYTLDELFLIYSKINSDRIGICIDLCHIFVAGSVDMRDKKAVSLFFKEFDRLFSLKNLTVIHYNDSNSKYDSHNDCHGDVSTGYITKASMGGSTDGFKVVNKYALKYGIPLILETPGIISYCDQIEKIKKL